MLAASSPVALLLRSNLLVDGWWTTSPFGQTSGPYNGVLVSRIVLTEPSELTLHSFCLSDLRSMTTKSAVPFGTMWCGSTSLTTGLYEPSLLKQTILLVSLTNKL